MAAVAGLMALVGEGAYTYLSTQPQLPPVSEVLGALAAASALLPAGLLLAKAVLRDRFHAELYRGRLYICAGVPSTGPPLAPGSVVVRPTGDVRGNGAYAAACIPAGTHLGDYSGDMLDKSAFDRRYPDGVGDFSMAVNDEWIVDAAHLAPDTAAFHPVHMNHSRVRPNVGRFYARSERRVAFFTLSDVEPGTELLYDYGRAYWQGREHMELP
ncbi:hypothetical protein HYH03_018639 [Edaphochlamys debaryana]|uniref:SET domain-containing protein n=1 Tax=Edaphochlamys debaryana TaxID=47281 RepID=A0A835XJV8_9CHLO|nr:hypothetical protein HYH03_018639 [Edaphochlamys debaryana]|eukprot:KAG2482435.1 hypothetical protein HYH03_018639 [Edaphochlamys debaryana]